MRLLLTRLAAFAALGQSLIAASPTPSATVAPSEEKSRFAFSLLPRAFQSHPQLDLVGLTEMTVDGKKLPAPDADHPVYYRLHVSSEHTEGEASGTKLKVDTSRLETSLQNSLGKAGYKPADDSHPATQAIFVIWGSHNTVSKGEDKSLPPDYWPNVISRARVVGGAKFAAEFEKALHDQFNAAVDMGVGNPLYRFTNRDNLTRELVEQCYDDCYFIVVSAYDMAALNKGQRTLLWRSKITTAANGVSLIETLPALVSSGTDYFGRDKPTPEIRLKRIDRKGEVILGPAEVTEYLDGKPAASPQTPPTEKNAQPAK